MFDRRSLLVQTLSAALAAPAAASQLIAGAKSGVIEFTAPVTRVPLQPAQGAATGLLAEGAEGRASLVLRGLHAPRRRQPVVEIYLNARDGARLGRSDPGFVGTLNFFGVPEAAEASGRAVSFDITEPLRKLRAARRLAAADGLALTFKSGAAAGQGPSAGIKEIELFIE